MTDTFFAGTSERPDTYRLVRRVGEPGGEGEVWGATQIVDGVEVAIALKIIHDEHADALDAWHRRWERQSEVLALLNDPRVARVRKVFVGPPAHPAGTADPTARTLYMVMEWVEGTTLDRWASAHPGRTLLDCAGMIVQVAEAVEYLHTSTDHPPVLHRDIKGPNVIVRADGRAVLVDFGMCRLEGAAAMTVVYTEGYVAPEARTGVYTRASDRYALGATAFQLVTDVLATGDPATDAAVLARTPRLAGQPGAQRCLLAMIDPDPRARPDDLAGWARHLAVADQPATSTAATGSTAATVVGSVPPTTEPRRRRLLVTVATLAAVALVTLGVWAVGTASSRDAGPDLSVSGRDHRTTSSTTTSTTTTTGDTATDTVDTTSTTIFDGTAGPRPGRTDTTPVAIPEFAAGTYSGSGTFTAHPGIKDSGSTISDITVVLERPVGPATVAGATAPTMTFEFPELTAYMMPCELTATFAGVDPDAGLHFEANSGCPGSANMWVSGDAAHPDLVIEGPELSGHTRLATGTPGTAALPRYPPGPYVGTATGLANYGTINVSASMSDAINPDAAHGNYSPGNDAPPVFHVTLAGVVEPYASGDCDMSAYLSAASPTRGYRFDDPSGCFNGRIWWLSGPPSAPKVTIATDAGTLVMSLHRA